MQLFGNNFEGNLNRYLLVEVDFGGVFAELFNGLLDDNELTVNFVTGFLKGVSNLDVVDRTKDCAVGGSLSGDGKGNAFESGSGSFGVGFELSELVGALALVLSELFERCCVGDDSFALRDKEVTTVTVLYFNDVVFIAEAVNIFFQYNFHNDVSESDVKRT